jgi:hypothetical protein
VKRRFDCLAMSCARFRDGGTGEGNEVVGAKRRTVISPADNADARVPAVPESPSTVLELYKLAVERADGVSARRGVANTFFLTVNTGLAALLGAKTLRWYVAAAGIVFALAWWALLRSYRRLNDAKCKVINAIEQQLLIKVFTDEWTYLKPTPGAGGGPRGAAITGSSGPWSE